jgi:hypothetical protein
MAKNLNAHREEFKIDGNWQQSGDYRSQLSTVKAVRRASTRWHGL